MLLRLGKWTHRLLRRLDRPVKTPVDDRPRGVALILALVTIVILSAAVVEFAYSSRVNTAMATNERDNLKSYYLAKSGVNLSRLLLSFQYALQEESRDTEDEMGQMIGRAMRRSNFQIYQYVDLLMGPFNSGAVEIPLANVDLQGMGVGGFGEFTGQFEVDVDPEEGRINLNKFAQDEVDDTDLTELCSMILDETYDPIFDQQDDYGTTLDRATVLANIIDFIDFNQQATTLGDNCTIESVGGDEERPYQRDTDNDIEPRNTRLTHVDELYRVHGVTEPFMDAFADSFTVYDVGRPNLNVAQAPVFYSVLCQNLELEDGVVADDQNPCSEAPEISQQVMMFAMAIEGIREFFDDPLSVMLAYVGTAESKLLPSARMGQPVAFLSVSQLPEYIGDLRENPQLMAQFLRHSPAYQEMVAQNPQMAVDPINPTFPTWSVEFSRSGLMRSVTTRTPRVFRIQSTGAYGSSRTQIEAVVDFDKTVRRLPDEEELIGGIDDRGMTEEELDAETEEMTDLLEQTREQRPEGRILYWRVE